ncbi:MAG: hypothetical protein ACM3U2_14890 [Deltaproteobacteria bacterium]
MSSCNHGCLWRGALPLALFMFLAGCGEKVTVETFHPEEDLAREALDTALTAWQNGLEKPGVIDTEEPAVQLVDPAWAAGTKLTSYEVVAELPGSTPPSFTVKLSLEGAAAPEETTFFVVGKDPLQVMRDSEFNRSAGM